MTGPTPALDGVPAADTPFLHLIRLLGNRDSAIERGGDVDAVLAAADREGLTALLGDASGSAPEGAGPLVDALRTRARAAIAREAFTSVELGRVLKVLADAGVDALVFKGTALAYSVYEQPWLRPRTDTDVLVSPHQADAAMSVLEHAGYVRSHAVTAGTLVSHQAAFVRSAGFGASYVIDLHWKIVNPQLLADALTFDDLWPPARAVPALGPAARVPSPAHAFVLACVHRLAHHQGQERLIWLNDLHMLAARFAPGDWKVVVDAAVAGRVAGLCLDGALAAKEAFTVPLPADVRTALADAARDEPSRRYLEAPMRQRDVLLSDLSTLPGWGPRLRLLSEHAFPPAAFMRSHYQVTSSLWLPPLYLWRLVSGAWKWMRA